MKSQNQIDMTTGPILNKLLRFSFPIILSNLLQLVFNAADLAVIGHFSGESNTAAVSAIGSTSSLINLLVNLFVGLSIGSNVVTANFFGQKKSKEINESVHTTIALSIYSGIILTVVGVLFAKQILLLMNVPETVLPLATLYVKIYFAGILATVIYNFASAVLRAKGDTKRPLYILSIAGAINVLLNLFFVIVLKMNVAGVAFATVISQCFAALCLIKILATEESDFKLSLLKLKINKDIFIKIIKIGVPAGLQGIMFSFSNVLIQSSINSFGEIVMTGNSVASNLEGFVYNTMNGFSQGTLTFVSQNRGVNKFDRIKKVVFTSESSVFLAGTLLGFLVIFLSPVLLKFYIDDAMSISEGIKRLKVICSTYALCGMMDVMSCALRGLGYSFLPMITTILGVCGLRILILKTIFTIPQFHTCTMVFLTYPISWGLTLAVHTAFFIYLYRKNVKEKKLLSSV